MLKNIPPILSPDLMAVMMCMGHGDELVLADGHFPAQSHAQRLVRADGHGVAPLLEAILRFFPIDTFVEDVAIVMRPVGGMGPQPPIWAKYRALIKRAERREIQLCAVERAEFYSRARRAYAIVATGESALYANLILKKGVVQPGKASEPGR
jgi:L-fucose mutarotase